VDGLDRLGCIEIHHGFLFSVGIDMCPTITRADEEKTPISGILQ
jgi:hypothetical protein